MSPLLGFFGFLGLTVVLLGCVAYTGMRAQRRRHLPLVFLALVSLACSIVYALKLGKLYDLDAAGPITPIHMFMARLTTVAYVLPIFTGIATIRNPTYRKRHGQLARILIALTLLTTLTGAIMLWKAPRIL